MNLSLMTVVTSFYLAYAGIQFPIFSLFFCWRNRMTEVAIGLAREMPGSIPEKGGLTRLVILLGLGK